jgi:hypothetical protein
MFQIAEGPGPPHRPHIRGSDDGDLAADSAPTAKTLSERWVRLEPQSGHDAGDDLDMDLTSCSKRR